MFRSQTQASDEPSDSCSIDAVAFGNSQEHRHRIALNRVDAQSTAITRLSRWRESKFRMGLKIPDTNGLQVLMKKPSSQRASKFSTFFCLERGVEHGSSEANSAGGS